MGKRRLRPAIELASDIGCAAADLFAHGDEAAERALVFLRQANPSTFGWLTERLMNTSYPCDLLFDIAVDDPRRRAILLAAAALELKTATDGTQIHVTVRSPQETYRFGQRTGDFLEGQPAPTPVKVTPESTDTKA